MKGGIARNFLQTAGAWAFLLCAAGCSEPLIEESSAPAPSSDSIWSLDESLTKFNFELHNGADGRVIGVDVLGLSKAELRAFELLDERARSDVFAVHVAGGAADLPAIGGVRKVAGKALRFTPRYPLSYDLSLQAVVSFDRLSGSASGKIHTLTWDFKTPSAPSAPAAEITAIYPSGEKLSENLLRFYIHFSRPMSRGEAYQRIHLLDAKGRKMDAVFLELTEELWDRNMQRFTLLCDPARVKRGLVPRAELGGVLEAGRDYTLVVDRDWPDANGQKLAAGMTKKFHVTSADVAPIDPASWKFAVPRAGTFEPLVVTFPKPLDHSLLQRLLTVSNKSGEQLSGQATIDLHETRWQFHPARPWVAGRFELVVDSLLEDVAGNSIGRAFDVDLAGPNQKQVMEKIVSIPFMIPAR